MVGGLVIEVIEVTPEKHWVNCKDDWDTCAVFCNPLGNKITPGDSLWWQSRECFWTKYEDGVFIGPEDISLPKIGFSGVNRP